MNKKSCPPALMSVAVPNYNQFFRSSENTDSQSNYDSSGAGDFQNYRDTQFQGHGLRQNAIERRLNHALQQPVDLGKGESMMKKMGWSGGGLGKSGEGIVEPIAPNAAYATNKQGLGKVIEENFDDRSSAVLQTYRHTHTHMDLSCLTVQVKENRKPKAKRSQFTTKLIGKSRKKEAKELLMTSVLEQLLGFVRNETKVELLLDKNLTNTQRKMVHKLVEDISGNTCVARSMEQVDLIQHIIEYSDYDLHTESCGKPQNRQLGVYKDAKDYMFLVIPEDLREEVEEKVCRKKTDECEEFNSVGDVKTIDDDDLIEWVELETNKAGVNNEQKKSDKTQNTEFLDHCNESLNTDKEVPFQSLFKTAELPNNKAFKKKLKREEENLVFKEELARNVSSKQFTVTEVLERLVEYFTDFINDDSFTEFRFLGLFNETEYEAMGIFFDICSGDKSHSNKVAEKLREALSSNTYCYSLGQNSNGSTILIKDRKS